MGLECGIRTEDCDWDERDDRGAFNTAHKRWTLEEACASMAAALEEVGIQSWPGLVG